MGQGGDYWKGVTCSSMYLARVAREAQEYTRARFSGVPPQTYMHLLQESFPKLPKAAQLCKAEIIWTSHHHTCSMPACLQGLTSSAHCLRQRPLHQAKSYRSGEDVQSQPRCIPPRQMTTIKKKCYFFLDQLCLVYIRAPSAASCRALPSRWVPPSQGKALLIIMHHSTHRHLPMVAAVLLRLFLGEQNEPLSRRCLPQMIYQTRSNFQPALLPAWHRAESTPDALLLSCSPLPRSIHGL